MTARHRVALVILGFLAACSGSTGATTTSNDSDTTGTQGPTSSVAEPTTTVGATTTTVGATTTTATGPESSLEAPLEVGRTAVVGEWRLRVVSVSADGTEAVMTENEFNDPPGEGKQFFIANVEATYTGDESSTFWIDMSLKAVGDSNVAYEAFEASCGVIPEDINSSGETFPGGTINGNVCWSVNNADAASLVMIAEETLSFDGSRQFLSLDPTATPVEDTTSVEGGGNSAPSVPIGTSSSVGIWDITVVSVTPDGTDAVMSANEFNDPPGEGEQFFMANLGATFTGDESSTFWIDMSLKALGESNVAYEAFEASCGVIPDDINDAGETFPGGAVSGNVCWRIRSDDAASLVMIAEESFTLEGTRVFFSLTG